MAKQTINTGTVANDGTGDGLRTAFTKVNANFTEVYGNVSTIESSVTAIQSNVSVLQSNVSTLNTNVSLIRNNVSILQANVVALESNQGGGGVSNTLDYLTLTNNGITGNIIYFIKTNNGSQIDNVDSNVAITRGVNGGLYNPLVEAGWDNIAPEQSPLNTLWNGDGWNDLSDVTTRSYDTFYSIAPGYLGDWIPNKELVMWDTENDKYYKIKITQWSAQGSGGGFSYTRELIDVDNAAVGIKFPDGTVQKTAAGNFLPQNKANIAAYSNYWLKEADFNKHIYYETSATPTATLRIRNNIDVPSEIGTQVVVISGNANTQFIVQSSPTKIYGSGFNGQYSALGEGVTFAIPKYSRATLLKVEEDTWILSGDRMYIS